MYFDLLWGRSSTSREKDADTENRKYQEDDEKADEYIRALVRIEHPIRKVKSFVEYPRISRLPVFFCHI